MDYEDELIKVIRDMSGKYNMHQIFTDFVTISAIAIQNACTIRNKIWKSREDLYVQVMNKYDGKEQDRFGDMFAMLSILYEKHGPYDALGSVYMKGEMGSKTTGQFFTPFHVSKLLAELQIEKAFEEIESKNILKMYEPSTGGGGMILAKAKVLHEKGINFQKVMKVTAQDLDWNGVYMTYVQLSLNGIDGVIAQGDTLTDPYPPVKKGVKFPKERIFRTPKHMGVLICG